MMVSSRTSVNSAGAIMHSGWVAPLGVPRFDEGVAWIGGDVRRVCRMRLSIRLEILVPAATSGEWPEAGSSRAVCCHRKGRTLYSRNEEITLAQPGVWIPKTKVWRCRFGPAGRDSFGLF